MNEFDLQMHSTASDGIFSPRDLVEQAKKREVTAIALTDHDTIDGIDEAFNAGKELGVEVIPAIELSCRHNQIGLHILGYGIDHKNRRLVNTTKKIKVWRIAKAKEMVRRLQEQGFEITYKNVAKRAKGGVIARPHIAFEILENPSNRIRLGEIKTKGDFITNFLVPRKSAYVKGNDLTCKETIEIIHGANGVAVWSHPAVHFPSSFKGLEQTLNELIALGLDGIEILNASMTKLESVFLHGLALKYHLLCTAGSDFERPHEAGLKREGGGAVGDFSTFGLKTDDMLMNLKEAIAIKKKP